MSRNQIPNICKKGEILNLITVKLRYWKQTKTNNAGDKEFLEEVRILERIVLDIESLEINVLNIHSGLQQKGTSETPLLPH